MEDAAVVEPPQTDVVAHDDLAEGVARQRKRPELRFAFLGRRHRVGRLDVDALGGLVHDEVDLPLHVHRVALRVRLAGGDDADIHRETAGEELVADDILDQRRSPVTTLTCPSNWKSTSCFR